MLPEPRRNRSKRIITPSVIHNELVWRAALVSLRLVDAAQGWLNKAQATKGATVISAEEFLRGRTLQIGEEEPRVEAIVDGDKTNEKAAVSKPVFRERDASSSKRFGRGESQRTAERKRSRSGFTYTAAEDPNDVEACKESALRLLDAAARSSGMLRDKLAEREYDPEVIEQVLARLEELGLIDDEEYARSVIRSCLGRMMGARGTVMELTRKGIDRQLAQRMVNETARTGAFEEAAWELGRSVAKKTRGKDLDVRKRRFWSAGGRLSLIHI